jgi:phosphomannomutase
MVMVLGILSRSGLTLSQLAGKYQKYATADEQNLSVTDTKAVISALKGTFGDGKSDELDGLTVEYPDWWFNVRASNTEPLLRLNVEAANQSLLEAKLAAIKAVLDK